ncbi:MAG: aspartyl/asparaginyl beta-hydroxylase domain-containing protein [Kiloniellales bacterium]
MTYLKRLAAGIQTAPLLHEIQAQPELWRWNTNRQAKVTCQRETESVYLRAAAKPFPEGQSGNDVQRTRRTRLAKRFPNTLGFCEAFAALEEGKLGRVALVKLQPMGRVYPHVDHGSYYRIRDRYHLVLDSDRGSSLMSGGQMALLREGELWVFDNKQMHEAANLSQRPRIHLIFDIEPAAGRGHYVYPPGQAFSAA